MSMYSQATHPHSELTNKIIGIAIKVHKELGPGFREKYYQRAMYLELKTSKTLFQREQKFGIYYQRAFLGYHVVDFNIENKVIVELKSASKLSTVDIGQLSKYLRLSKCQIGLLLNFGQEKLEIKRIKI